MGSLFVSTFALVRYLPTWLHRYIFHHNENPMLVQVDTILTIKSTTRPKAETQGLYKIHNTCYKCHNMSLWGLEPISDLHIIDPLQPYHVLPLLSNQKVLKCSSALLPRTCPHALFRIRSCCSTAGEQQHQSDSTATRTYRNCSGKFPDMAFAAGAQVLTAGYTRIIIIFANPKPARRSCTMLHGREGRGEDPAQQFSFRKLYPDRDLTTTHPECLHMQHTLFFSPGDCSSLT